LITLVVYLPAGRHEFIVFDDPDYVTENRIVQDGITLKGIGWAFTSFHASNWHPVTWWTHMLDVQFFGLQAGGHHLVSAAYHAANSVLFFLALRLMTGALWPSAFAAALFAVHPAGGISRMAGTQRRGSGFFWMLTMLAYGWHAPAALSARRALLGARVDEQDHAAVHPLAARHMAPAAVPDTRRPVAREPAVSGAHPSPAWLIAEAAALALVVAASIVTVQTQQAVSG
jgi:hypothetical protein